MAEPAPPGRSANQPPGAPSDALTIGEAHRRWIRFRAEVWTTLAEVRGQRARLTVLRHLRPGSLAFRVVAGAAASIFSLRRRFRPPATPVSAASTNEFPFGSEPTRMGWWRPLLVNDVDVFTIDGDDLADVVQRANGALAGEGWLLVVDDTDDLLEGAANQMAILGATESADLVFGDERVRYPAGRTR